MLIIIIVIYFIVMAVFILGLCKAAGHADELADKIRFKRQNKGGTNRKRKE